MLLTNIGALQGLYVALGGDIGDVANINTIPDMLEAVASVAGGAGGNLPAVTSEDNGDILGVVEGAWAKRDPELPAVNGDDNGKILGVNNGAWDAVAAPLPTVAAEDIGEALIVESDGEGGAQWGKGNVSAPQNVEVFECWCNDPPADGGSVNLSNSKTWGDICQAVKNNKFVVLRLFTGGGRQATATTYDGDFICVGSHLLKSVGVGSKLAFNQVYSAYGDTKLHYRDLGDKFDMSSTATAIYYGTKTVTFDT